MFLLGNFVLTDQESDNPPNLGHTKQAQSTEVQEISTFSDLMTDYPSRYQRFSALYELTDRSDEDDLVDLIHEVETFEYDDTNQQWRADALLVLLSKLIHTNTDRVNLIFFGLNEDSQRDLAYGVANEWSFMDLEGAIKFTNQFSDFEVRMLASTGTLHAQSAILSLEELTVLANDLENDTYIAELIQKRLFIKEAQDPASSWNELVQDPSFLVQENIKRILNIAEAWVAQIGVSAIPNVTEVIKDPTFRRTLQYRLLHVAALQDAASTFEYALTIPGNGLSSPASSVLST